MDSGIHAAKLNTSVGCRKWLAVMDAASISASKVFEVPAIIVMQQKQNTGIYAAKLNANIQCRQHLAPHQQVYILNF